MPESTSADTATPRCICPGTPVHHPSCKARDTERDTFNPHGNRTSNGRVITVGMRVLDYDLREGVVVSDSYDTMHEHGHCRDDHWFNVRRDDNGDTMIFNGDRLKAL